VSQRVLQALVAVVLGQQPVVAFIAVPGENARLSVSRPEESSARFRLVAPVDAHRVVRRRAAEVCPPARLKEVDVGAGIDQQLLAVDPERERQRVRVAVRGQAQVA